MRKKHLTETIKVDSANELILYGRAVSTGIGIGKSLCLYGTRKLYPRYSIKKSRIANELLRFRSSLEDAKKQLEKISSNEKKLGKYQAEIFDTHKLLLEDRSFLSEIEETVVDQKVNAEWAVKVVKDLFVEKYKALPDKHIREKYIDLEDVSERLLNSLGGEEKNTVKIDKNTIVIAKEINPSTLIEISRSNPQALVTENGGWTSHTFILARELKIPAVTGVKHILHQIEDDEEVIVDGFNGEIILGPTDNTIQNYELTERHSAKQIDKVLTTTDNMLKTLDGFEVMIRANIDSSSSYEVAKGMGAKGIGLYRSDFLFNQKKDFPSEKEQAETYTNVANLVGDDGVRIRTFDLTLEEVTTSLRDREKNPALGLRGIRLAKRFEDKFREQIRAILKASFQRNVDIILPMISDVSEIIWAKHIIYEEKERFKSKGVDFGNPKLGSMIEVPAAILAIDKIFAESDFVSVGTNDLVQYLLAVDRDNDGVADWFKTLHPAVLSSLKIVLNASRKFEKPAIICGEMAGSPLYVPILIAYGANELSMNPNSITRIRNTISGIAQKEAKLLVNDLEKCKTANDIEELLSQQLKERWGHLTD